MYCYVTLSNVFLINAYKDVYSLFTATKAGQLQAMFVFYCAISNSMYCRVYLFISWGSNFVHFVSFLSMIILL